MVQVDLLIVAPLVLAIVCALVGGRTPAAARWLGLAAPVVQIALLVSLFAAWSTGERIPGAMQSNVAIWRLVADGLSLPLLALTALTGLLAVSASWRTSERPGAHFALLAVLQGAVAAVFLADSLVLFYIAWESVLVPMFLLIGGWGSSDARRAAMKFLIYTFAGGAVLLAGIIYTIVVGNSDSITTLAAAGGAGAGGPLVFWLLAIGFLVKLPAVPVHTWLPDAHTEAPTAGSIVLAGVLLKMGGYGLLRLAIPLAPAGFESAAPVLAALGVLGIVWGAVTALVQTDLKRLVAYSSVAHMGFVLLAVAAATPTSLAAALFTMLSHGFVAGLLFYLVGAIYQRSHTRELSRYGGLGAITPRWATAFVFASLASAGLPGLSGFPGEYVTILESFTAFGWWMLVAAVGVVLAAAYNLRAVRETVQGPGGSVADIGDLDSLETSTAAITAVVIVALGLAPSVVTAAADPVLSALAMVVGGGA